MLSKWLKEARTVAIGGHERPDGDCVGSCTGLYQYIKKYYKDVEVDLYLEDIPESFHFIKATEDIRHEIPEGKVYDVFLSLDCGDAERLGFSLPLFKQAKKTCCVDHHISNPAFADENYIVPDASSTSELIYHILDDEKITREIAESLYLGIVHDTGVFQYSCAAPETFRVAAALLEKGVDAPTLIESTFYAKSYAQNQILGRALLESILFMNGRCIASSVTKEEMEFYGVTSKDLEGIVSQLRVTEGVELAVFMYELETGVFKVSLRSKKTIDVSQIAQCFGGGGHVRAAGFTMPGTTHDIINNVTRQVQLQLNSKEEA